MRGNQFIFGKMAVLFISTFLAVFTMTAPAHSFHNPGALFLLISPSPQANAMGQTYANTAWSCPMASVFNPASLGFFAKNNYFGRSWYPKKTAWLPGLAGKMSYNAETTAFGINLKNIWHGIPISIGVAQHKILLDMGEIGRTGEHSPEVISTFHSRDKVKGTTFSVAVDYSFRASIGYTIKNFQSQLPPMSEADREIPFSASSKAVDLGFLLEFPVYDLFKKSHTGNEFSGSEIQPFVDTGLYFSVNNIGKHISYFDGLGKDLLPRNLTLGIHLHAGLEYSGKRNKFHIFAVQWAREVNNLLINNKTNKYVFGLNNINLWENLVIGKSGKNVIVRQGYEFNFGDFIFIRKGKYKDTGGHSVFETKGHGLSYLQPVKILAELLDIEHTLIIDLISKISFESHHARYYIGYGHPLSGTKFKSFLIRVTELPFI